MGIFDSLNKLNDIQPFDLEKDEYASNQTPAYDNYPSRDFQEEFNGFKYDPVLYNIDGYISPYASANWGGTSVIMSTFDDESKMPPAESTRVDPNKIFSSDISALKALAADQIRVTKLFEKRLVESLREKGKFGLTEEDVIAMQALTAARSSITAINKEQIAIKKNIADLRIKQNSMGTGNASTGNSNTGAGGGMSNSDIGKAIMDRIFDTPSAPIETQASTMPNTPELDLDQAAKVIDSLIPSSTEVSDYTKYEQMNPTTYVVLGETDDDVEYETYSETGELLVDYPNPTAEITNIDRDAKVAKDQYQAEYPIRFK